MIVNLYSENGEVVTSYDNVIDWTYQRITIKQNVRVSYIVAEDGQHFGLPGYPSPPLPDPKDEIDEMLDQLEGALSNMEVMMGES